MPQSPETPPAGPPADPSVGRGRGRIAAAVGVSGEVLITLGLLLGLFVVYSLWWTDVLADRQADVDGQRLRQSWVAQSRPHSDGVPRPDYRRGEEIGFLRIPRLGRDYQLPVALGTDLDILNQGVAGAYLAPYRSAMPWDRSGNFAMAAHRDGHGAAFHNLPELRPGDRIGFETRDTWYLYTVARVLPRTDKFDVGVVAPVPRGSGFHGPGRYITLTTCTPAYTSLYRMAVWGRLTETIPVDVDRDIPSQLQ